MKVLTMKCSLLLLFIPLLGLSGNKGQQVEKSINREFNIQSNGLLGINNRYGSIDIAIGEGNKVKMDILITVEAPSTKKAQEAMDRISIEFDEGTNRVQATTEIESSSSWSTWFDNDNVDIEINYTVLAPVDVYLDLVNKYGDIYVETTNRDLKIDLGYGDIRLGDINAKLSLDMAYSEGTTSRIQDGDLDLSYSDLAMEDAQSVNLDMKYTDLVMGSATRLKVVSSYSDLHGKDVDEVMYSGKYDDLYFERVKTIDVESGYSGMEIEGLSQSGNFEMRYGDLRVDNIGNQFTKLNINTSYTGVELRFAGGTSYTIDAQNNYCDIQHDGLKVSEDIQKGGSLTLKGTKGTGGGMVYVRMNYGELSIE